MSQEVDDARRNVLGYQSGDIRRLLGTVMTEIDPDDVEGVRWDGPNQVVITRGDGTSWLSADYAREIGLLAEEAAPGSAERTDVTPHQNPDYDRLGVGETPEPATDPSEIRSPEQATASSSIIGGLGSKALVAVGLLLALAAAVIGGN